jgi:uncharacterized metal-binding protein YceD (DUF177 family)
MTRETSQGPRPPHSRPLWSAPLAIHEVSETGRHVELVADDGTRAALANAIGLRALPRLEASFDVSRQGRDGLHMTGQVSATVGQICVVTLEPIENEIEESIDLVFKPAGESEMSSESATSEVADNDAPEPLVGGVVDLGAVATEFLTLGIDPHPRKPDAEFTAPASGDDAAAHPFAALAALKKGRAGS